MQMIFKTIVLALLLLLSGCEEKETITAEVVTDTQPKKPPTFTLHGMDGNSYTIVKHKEGLEFKEFGGKVVLLNFYATWCPPCRAEIPHLNSLQAKYLEQFKVVSLTMDKNKEDQDLKAFMDEHQISYLVTNGPENTRLAKELGGVKSIPFMIMYDLKGNYFTHYIGAVPEEMLEADIKRALEAAQS